MLEDATLFRVLLELLKLDDFGEFLSEFHMHHVPLGLLRIRLLVVVGMVFVESSL